MDLSRIYIPFTIMMIIVGFLSFYNYYIETKEDNPIVIALMLHSVSEIEPTEELNRLVISKQNFTNNIVYLKNKGYNFVGESDVRKLFNGDFLDNKSKNIWLTFDDGYIDNYEVLYPILKENQTKALINIIVNYTENGDTEGRGQYMNWEQVNEMKESGLVDFGSHSFDSHYYKYNAQGKKIPMLMQPVFIDNKLETYAEYLERVKADFFESWALMNLRMGQAPKVIAYPYGKASKTIKAIARYVGFDIEFGIKNGFNDSQNDFKNIKRINISNDYSPEEVEALINYYRGIAKLKL